MRSLTYCYWPHTDGDVPPPKKTIGRDYRIAVLPNGVIEQQNVATFLDLPIHERLNNIYEKLKERKIQYKRAKPNSCKQRGRTKKSKSNLLETESPVEEIFEAFSVKAVEEQTSSFKPYNTMNGNNLHDTSSAKLYQIVYDGDTIVGCLDAIKKFAAKNGIPKSDILEKH